MSFEGIVGKIIEHYGKVQFDWKVENILSDSKPVDNRYHSPVLNCWGISFYLQLYPNGEKRYESEEWISLYLTIREPCFLTEVRYQFSIKTAHGEIENSISGSGPFGRKRKRWGVPKFLDRTILLSRKNEWAPSGVLTVAVTLEKGIPQMDKCSEKVLQDITKAWQSGENSDVVVHVGDVEFPAHRVILGARSPVLFAMFQHDTTESRSGVIKISDCDPEVFREFLNYIYTGGPQELTSRNAAALYAVAEKYLAEDLKGQCLKYMLSNLGIETFCEAYTLALNYGEKELLQLATNFASENIRQIVKSVGWKRFMKDDPTTANEILIQALG